MGAIADGFVAYAQPLLDETDGSYEQLNKAFMISQLCFNLSLLADDKRDTAVNAMQPTLHMDDKEFDEFRRTIVVPMIERHQQLFPLMHRRGSAAPSRSVTSPPVPVPVPARSRTAEPAETYFVTAPYAQCPCNSGKKYKFCCRSNGR